MKSHIKLFSGFSLVGMGVFLFGELLLFSLMSVGLHSAVAYFIQAVVCIQVSFVANWILIFKDSDFVSSLIKFNISRGVVIPLNQIGFMGIFYVTSMLVYDERISGLIANAIVVAVFTVINYIVGYSWAFKSKSDTKLIPPPCTYSSNTTSKSIAVVIPVKSSEATIRNCVESLISQSQQEREIILVGDENDSTWDAIDDYIEDRSVTVIETVVKSPGRDANAKRKIGIEYAINNGYEILALTDSDMVLPYYWLETGGDKIYAGWQCVAGPMQSVTKGFWATYVDRNPILAKTPRMNKDYVVTKGNFGKNKPPITANVFFTSSAYHLSGGIDPNFVRDYEDYEFFASLAKADVNILCTNKLVASHNHREGLKTLSKDYVASGWGCADFIQNRPYSPLAQQRKYQSFVVLCMLVFLCSVLFTSFVIPTVLVGLIVFSAISYSILGIYSSVKSKYLGGFLFPLVTSFFVLSFVIGLCKGKIYNLKNKNTNAIIGVEYVISTSNIKL